MEKSQVIDIFARTLYGEARGEPLQGIEAVASVIMNRVRFGGWFGSDIVSVCTKPYQFSCWNENDPNRKKIEFASTDDSAFQVCLRVAARAEAGTLVDPTGGATHYHALAVNPKWSLNKVPVFQIGRHLFYKDI